MAFTIDSKVGELLDNPAARAVLDKYIPEFSANPLVRVARDSSLKWISAYSGAITADKLAAINSALANVADNEPHKTVLTIDSKVGELLDNPKAKAILDKHIPEFAPNPLVNVARDSTLKLVSAYSNGTITPDKLAAINADLAKL